MSIDSSRSLMKRCQFKLRARGGQFEHLLIHFVVFVGSYIFILYNDDVSFNVEVINDL